MKNKSMTFPEAVGYLADRANITLEFEDKKLSVIQKKKENIFLLLEHFALPLLHYYHLQLMVF